MSTHRNSKQAVRFPFYIAVALVFGILIGSEIPVGSSGGISSGGFDKIKQILTYIDNDYVDDVDTEELVNETIDKMLEQLDPHTNYITKEDSEIMRAHLQGNFEGIGIEFNIFKDTIHVIAPLSGGPSIKAGLRSGDKIIKVNDELVAGRGFTNRDVVQRLRGEKGSKVVVSIKRKGEPSLLNFDLIRDVIPQFSVDAAYMVDKNTGYIKISQFSATTYREFKEALNNLLSEGMNRLILDLTGNPGGYLDQAVDMADDFIAEGKMIVYTEGKESRYDEAHIARHDGDFEDKSLVVMIDEGSASAAEVVTGAIQDHDRGIVVGRRSFGKGLVQLPVSFTDGSELRLTISRYYTPSGRSIQKPYTDDSEEYHGEFATRYETGELFHKDSIKVNESLVFQTKKGRKVYGGGGIVPDVFVPLDTSLSHSLLHELFRTNTFAEYGFRYFEQQGEELKGMELRSFITDFKVSNKMLENFRQSALSNDIYLDEGEFEESLPKIKLYIKAHIARRVWDREGFYPVFNQTNDIYLKAVTLFDEADELLNR